MTNMCEVCLHCSTGMTNMRDVRLHYSTGTTNMFDIPVWRTCSSYRCYSVNATLVLSVLNLNLRQTITIMISSHKMRWYKMNIYIVLWDEIITAKWVRRFKVPAKANQTKVTWWRLIPRHCVTIFSRKVMKKKWLWVIQWKRLRDEKYESQVK